MPLIGRALRYNLQQPASTHLSPTGDVVTCRRTAHALMQRMQTHTRARVTLPKEREPTRGNVRVNVRYV